MRSFLLKELSASANIRNKEVMKSVTRGVSKLVRLVDDRPEPEGRALFSDGEEVIQESYPGRKFLYRCDNEYVKVEVEVFHPNLLVVIDADEATIGTTDMDDIKVLWSETSFVPRKHDMGGQSKARYQRAREEALKQWLRKVVEMVRSLNTEGRRILVGGPGMTKDKFVNELPS